MITYTFPPFTTTPSDCGIFSYSISFESSPITTYPAASCATDPCQSVDISLEVSQTLTFNIEVTANGGATADSTTQITVEICGNEIVNLQGDISSYDLEYDQFTGVHSILSTEYQTLFNSDNSLCEVQSYSLVKLSGTEPQLLEEGLSEVIYINSDTQDIEIHTEIATSDTNSLFIMACTMSQSCGYIPLSFKILALEDNQEFLEDLINQAPIFETKTFSLDQELSEEMTFQLPDIFDANADEVTVEVQGL